MDKPCLEVNSIFRSKQKTNLFWCFNFSPPLGSKLQAPKNIGACFPSRDNCCRIQGVLGISQNCCLSSEALRSMTMLTMMIINEKIWINFTQFNVYALHDQFLVHGEHHDQPVDGMRHRILQQTPWDVHVRFQQVGNQFAASSPYHGEPRHVLLI